MCQDTWPSEYSSQQQRSDSVWSTEHSSETNPFVKAMIRDDSNRRPFSVDESDDDDDDDEEQSSVSSNVSYPEIDRSSDGSEKMTFGAGENGKDDIKIASAVETARVDRWRFLVIGSIFVAGAAVSCLTYLTLNAGQTNDAYNAVSHMCAYYSTIPSSCIKLCLNHAFSISAYFTGSLSYLPTPSVTHLNSK